MECLMMIRYVGLDADGIPRVFGEDEDSKVAWDNCKIAVREYCNRRPEFQSHSWTVIDEEEWRDLLAKKEA
jgi:hypothetical protein